MAINTGRVISGGFVTGVLMNAGDFLVNGVLMKDENNAMMKKMGIMDPDAMMSSVSKMIPFFVMDFIFGFLAIWLYALIRPRLGAGPKTALVATFFMWATLTTMWSFFLNIDLVSMSTFIKGSGLTLVMYAIATLVGAAIYKEA